MYPEIVFESIRDGNMTLDQFDEWLDERRSEWIALGYETGYDAAQPGWS